MNDEKFLIYTKGYCGWCTKAKNLISKHGYAYDEFKLEQAELMESFRTKFPNAKTVPQIVYVKDGKEEYIGGYDRLAVRMKELTKVTKL